MKILGFLLIFIGGLWVVSRLMNQPIMMRMLRQGDTTPWKYFTAELFTGFGPGLLLVFIGYKLTF